MRALLVVLVLLAATARADAYEFTVRARTIGQAFELRSFRLVGGDVLLGRRRFTQALLLHIHDLGDLEAERRRFRPNTPGPVISIETYLRLDHDFGDWTMGELVRDGVVVDAVDGVPELASSSLALDVLYAHLDARGLLGGRVDLRVGRQVRIELLDAWAFDGATVRVRTPWRLAVEVAGGARVRDDSFGGHASYELDGTPGADCREYVEGATPGTGSWQIIDRSRVPSESPFTADLDYCPERTQAVPTFGVAVETEDVRAVHARLSYRRSMSRTVGLIGPVDRLEQPDLGLYPNERGQAPAWGVDEERIALTLHGRIAPARRVRVLPWAGARWSLLHGLADELVAGARVELGAHALEPEVARSIPTFDGDSIWNVFAAEPSSDARLGWSWRPARAPWELRAQAWLRRYDLGDAHAHAGGGDASAAWRAGRLALRLDALADGGWGGRRLGGTAALTWRRTRDARYGVRAALLDVVDEGDRPDPAARPGGRLHGSLGLGGTWTLVDGVGFHAVAEATSSRVDPGAVRVLGVVDLAFVPEM